jgi:hypothetical protein
MRLRADVRQVTGATRHYRAHIEGDVVVKNEELPSPAWVEIEPGDGAFYLLYMTPDGDCLTDSWHQTLLDAKEQARFEFGIEEGDWEAVVH